MKTSTATDRTQGNEALSPLQAASISAVHAPAFRPWAADAALDPKLPIFDIHSGYSLTPAARELALQNVDLALHLVSDALGQIEGGKHGICRIEIRGIGGSFNDGKPRLGLFPPDVSYSDARNLEGQKSHGHGGELISNSGQRYPSDIDMSVIFKPVSSKVVTLGDSVELTKLAHAALEKIFDRTRVLISMHDGDPMTVRPIDEIRRSLPAHLSK